MSFSDSMVYLAIYSIAGWALESAVASVRAKRFVNKGLMAGPFALKYGLGALFLLLFIQPWAENPVLYTAVGTLALSVLIFIGNYFLEKIWKIRWRDQGGKRLHLKGRVSLQDAVYTAALVFMARYVTQPLLISMFAALPQAMAQILSSAVVVLFIFSLIGFLSAYTRLLNYIEQLRLIIARLKETPGGAGMIQEYGLTGALARLREGTYAPGDARAALAGELALAAEKLGNARRLIRSYPNLQPAEGGDLGEILLSVPHRIKEPLWLRVKARLTAIFSAEAKIEAVENPDSFAHGLNGYKLFWVFLLSSVIGWALEVIFCVITTGALESRQGLIYGPFSQVYGLGGVLMVLFLSRFKKSRDIWVFLGSAIIGGLFEWFCSWAQEAAFGTVSWDYAEHNFSILGGRTSLMFCLMWGVLGLVLLRYIFPMLTTFIEKIPNRIGRPLTWILLVLILADMILSGAAVYRQGRRQAGIPPANAAAVFLDENYPDEFLEKIYPNMTKK